MEHFGLASLDDLPRPEELPVVLRQAGPLEDADEPESAEPGATLGSDVEPGGAESASADEAADQPQGSDGPGDPKTALAAVLAHASGRPETADGGQSVEAESSRDAS